MRRFVSRSVLVAALAAASFAACGGDDGDDDAGGTPGDNTGENGGENGGDGDALTVVAENIQWTEDSYSAAAGEVTIVLENNDNVRHTLLIDGVDGFGLEVEDEGDTDQGSVELEAGDYEIFCDVPGHSAMRADLTVE